VLISCKLKYKRFADLSHLCCAGQAYNCLAAILYGQEKFDESEVVLRRVLKIQETALGPDCPELILTLELLAMLLNAQGRTDEIEPVYRRMKRLEAILDASAVDAEEGE
jgi:hypothetical protein